MVLYDTVRVLVQYDTDRQWSWYIVYRLPYPDGDGWLQRVPTSTVLVLRTVHTVLVETFMLGSPLLERESSRDAHMVVQYGERTFSVLRTV
jgi:hypothetical protein